MNEIMENIKSRRSRRSFLEKEIPADIIEDILEAGRYAPSALNKQPWKFIVISNKDVIRKLSAIIRRVILKIVFFLPILKFFKPELKDPRVEAALKKTFSSDTDTVFYGAPLLILIVAHNKAGRYAVKDCSFAAQNMMLYANSVGIASCFIGRADMLGMSSEGKKILGLRPDYKIHAALVFGYTPMGEEIPVPQRIKDNVINWVR
jgi:nitroreductase